VIVLLACLSTAVGLIIACSEYFERLLPRVSYRVWVTLFTLVSFGFANVGLSTIIKLSVPALMLLYPLTMALVALAFLHRLFGGRRIVYACTIAGTAIIALFDGWKTFSGVEDGAARELHLFLEQYLPLYPVGLGWVVPSIVGFCIGLLLSKSLPDRTRSLGA
ncbi:MAG: branched-chain amino acid transport system II carrier protein, partial [Lautropia sp.]|nr:branched-chain amino acid transport system II carrier protein [Lautropia sp.]